MAQFSLEQSAEKISQSNTKEYFNEVMQSYTIGSYRSAVVMLYSVVISDLVYKLKELKDLYGDSTAVSILDSVKAKQEQKPESGEWEILLIKEIEQRTFLLEPIDKNNLLYLREQRHLSAHPVLTKDDLLSCPNQETVRALMRNMLEGILTKGAVMTTKVFGVLLEDLEEHANSFADDKALEKYLDSRYFKNINSQLIKDIFKKLWNITFKCQSSECKNNRIINYKAIKIIYKKYPLALNEYIQTHISYFSRFEINDFDTLERLVAMLGHYSKIYDQFEEHTQSLLKDKVNEKWILKVKAPFLEENMVAHFESLNECLYSDKYDSYEISIPEEILLRQWAEEEGCKDLFYDLLIKYFINSRLFDIAKSHFKEYIEPNLEEFSIEQYRTIYEGINNNSQCRNHRMATQHNSIIKSFSDRLFEEDFDFEGKYPKLEFEEGEF